MLQLLFVLYHILFMNQEDVCERAWSILVLFIRIPGVESLKMSEILGDCFDKSAHGRCFSEFCKIRSEPAPLARFVQFRNTVIEPVNNPGRDVET